MQSVVRKFSGVAISEDGKTIDVHLTDASGQKIELRFETKLLESVTKNIETALTKVLHQEGCGSSGNDYS
jgi:hypothetical protein